MDQVIYFTRSFLLLLVSFTVSTSLACISSTQTSRSFEILGKEGNGYRIRVTEQATDMSGQPSGPKTTNEFIEDDYYLVSRILIKDIIENPSKAKDRKEALKEALAGLSKYLKEGMAPYVEEYDYALQASHIRERAGMLESFLGRMDSYQSNEDLVAAAKHYETQLNNLDEIYNSIQPGFGHEYQSANGGDSVAASSYPTYTKSTVKSREIASPSTCSNGLSVTSSGIEKVGAAGPTVGVAEHTTTKSGHLDN